MVPLLPATLRLLAVPDASAVRALAICALADMPSAERMLAALERALTGATEEYQGIIACDASAIVGVVVFGETAGARAAGRIHLLAVDARSRRRGIGTDLINAMCAQLREQGGRLIIAELPADAQLASVRRLAERAGFHEEGRIDGYVREGVALVLLRRDL